MKAVLATLLLVALVLCSSPATTFLQTAMATDLGTCDAQCGSRCAKAGFKDRCLKYCGVCCNKCKCVPSGTYGNKHECPCYRDLKNTKGQPKCP